MATEQNMFCLNPGTILDGRYRIVRVLGTGGFGITYEAVNERINRRVAVKEFFCRDYAYRNTEESASVLFTKPDSEQEFDRAKKKFLHEARVIGEFTDEAGIVSVVDYFEENATAYIVMSYLDGVTLDKYRREHTGFDKEKLADLFLPLVETLGKVHERGIIHRDISPDNIMVQRDGSLTLIDFGAARDYCVQQQKTYSVVLKGGYAPCEQYSEQGDQGPWTDVYALCAVLYECISGQRPVSSISRMLHDELKMPSELGIQAEPEVEAVLKKGLRINHEERYQSMEELAEALREWRKKEEQPQKKKTGRRGLLTAGVLAALILIGAAVCTRIAFDRKEATAYDPQTMYRIVLKPDEETTVREFYEDLEKLKGRVDALTDNGAYSLATEEEQAVLLIGKEAFAGYTPDKILSCYLSRPAELYLVDKDDIQHDETGYIARPELESVELCSGTSAFIPREDAEKLGLDPDRYQYLKLTLTQECAKRLAPLLEDYEAPVFAQDAAEFYDCYYYHTYPAGDGRTFYVLNHDTGGRFAESAAYNLTHEPLSHAFYYVIPADADIRWQEARQTERKGKNQCDVDELPEDAVTLVYGCLSSYETLSEGEKTDLETGLKTRLDALDVPYAYGFHEGYRNDGTFSIGVRTVPSHMGAAVAETLAANYNVSVRAGIWEMAVNNRTELRYTFENGICKISLAFPQSRYEEIAKLAKRAAKDGVREMYLMLGEHVYSTAPLEEAAADGRLEFAGLELWEGEETQEQAGWLLEYLKLQADSDNRKTPLALKGARYGAADTVFADPAFGIRDAGREADVRETVQELCPQAEVRRQAEKWEIQLHLQADDDLPQKGLSLVRQIYEKLDFANQADIGYLIFYLVDEDYSEGQERCRVSFSKIYGSMHTESAVSVRGSFANGRIEPYKEEIKRIIGQDDFFGGFGEKYSEWVFEFP